MKLSAAALLALALAGCAHAPVDEPVAKRRPLASYAADPFVPVNLYLNANEQAAGERAALIEYAARQLRDSGAFVRLDRGVQRWPVTIQARYELEEQASGGRRVLSLLTFGLVSVPLSQKHSIVAEIFDEPDSIAVLDLAATVDDAVSAYGDEARRRAERAAIDGLLERMLAEIAQRKLIPRWSEFKPEPPPKRKKPRPIERPT
jgi:hypothetical protein